MGCQTPAVLRCQLLDNPITCGKVVPLDYIPDWRNHKTHNMTGHAKVNTSKTIVPALPRSTVQMRLPDGRIFEGPTGTLLETFIQQAWSAEQAPVMAALVDGHLSELTYVVSEDIHVRPVTMSDSDGMRIYQRSLAFLLVVAAHELFPEARVLVDHSLTMGGLFCELMGRAPLSAEEVAQLDQRMHEIAAADAPITRRNVPVAEAVALFAQQNDLDKVNLLKYRRKDYLPVYELRGVVDYFFGYMLPSTAYLHLFTAEHYPPGFLMRFPRRRAPYHLPAYQDFPRLADVLHQHRDWMEIMKIEDVGSLNDAIKDGRMQEVVLVNEALHEQRIAHIAHEIADRRGQVRLILIAGPSSSGKTTFAKRLVVQMLAHGMRPFALEMDNYFLERNLTPRDAQGNYDFESLDALDRALLNTHLLDLMAGREVTLPRYNFRVGQREAGSTVRLPNDAVILAEGIHGLNPNLVPDIPPECIYRIYVSALTQLNLDDHNRIPTTDTRLLRRIVRDAQYRGYTAQATIQRWESVRSGETAYIFPYQENADEMFNSALVYELAVLKPFVEPLLLQIENDSLEYIEARRLLAFLQWFEPCSLDLVPDNSLLREFIGGSSLQDFSLLPS